MGAGHNHSSPDTRVSRMLIAAAILSGFFVLELTTALLINSIALLADAGHMLTDLVAMFMGLSAVLLARHGMASPARTYGWHRAEVFTAVANAVLLLGVAAFILFEAFNRLRYEIAIVIVDHHLDLALALSDRTVILERGAVTWTGASKLLRDDLELRRQKLWM